MKSAECAPNKQDAVSDPHYVHSSHCLKCHQLWLYGKQKTSFICGDMAWTLNLHQEGRIYHGTREQRDHLCTVFE